MEEFSKNHFSQNRSKKCKYLECFSFIRKHDYYEDNVDHVIYMKLKQLIIL